MVANWRRPRQGLFSGGDGVLLRNYLALPGFSGGLFVAAGDVNGDRRADVVVGAGTGSSPVRVFDSSANRPAPLPLNEFLAYPGSNGGVRVALRDVTGDGVLDIIAAPGPGSPTRARRFQAMTGALIGETLVYDAAFVGGAFLAAG